MAGDFKLYNYDPSLVAAVIFIVLFVLSTSVHVWQLIRKKTHYFTPFVIGGIFEACGYAARSINANETPNWSVGPYSGQSLLLLLAPALFAASVYMILGRIVNVTDGGTLSLVKPKWLAKIFVTGDVLSFLIQSGGGAMLAQAKDQSNVNLGENMIIVGLFVQIVFFGIFMLVSIIFHKRIIGKPTERSVSLTVPWQKYMIILYTASMLILVRSVYRVVEYIQGSDGVIQSHEVYLYVFDATLMFLLSILFNVYHPSQIISGKIDDMERIEMLDDYRQIP